MSEKSQAKWIPTKNNVPKADQPVAVIQALGWMRIIRIGHKLPKDEDGEHWRLHHDPSGMVVPHTDILAWYPLPPIPTTMMSTPQPESDYTEIQHTDLP